MKSTLLPWGSQMIANGQVSQEERLLQGHHRQSFSRSLRVYSRDDEHVRRGGRFMTPQHRGSQHPIQEPGVQMEFFRKASGTHSWRCFNFTSMPAEPVEPDQPSDDQGVVDLADSSSSSSSESAGSSDSDEVEQPPKKRGRPPAELEVFDELLLAASTSVQHAMIASSHAWHPYFQGTHLKSACGARLDPDRTRFFLGSRPELKPVPKNRLYESLESFPALDHLTARRCKTVCGCRPYSHFTGRYCYQAFTLSNSKYFVKILCKNHQKESRAPAFATLRCHT